MGKATKLIFYLFLIVSMLTVTGSPLVFAQQEKESVTVNEIAGDVVSVDLKNSTIVIKYLKDEESTIYEPITVYVDSSTSIDKNGQAVTLAEIKGGDRVTVEYVADETGKKIASNIQVEP